MFAVCSERNQMESSAQGQLCHLANCALHSRRKGRPTQKIPLKSFALSPLIKSSDFIEYIDYQIMSNYQIISDITLYRVYIGTNLNIIVHMTRWELLGLL